MSKSLLITLVHDRIHRKQKLETGSKERKALFSTNEPVLYKSLVFLSSVQRGLPPPPHHTAVDNEVSA